jgi:hypothetical protein
MNDLSRLNKENITAFVAAWYVALDVHAPIEECNKFLAKDGLRMVFPDGDITDLASFKTWYDRVTNIFFDENHNVQSVEATVSATEASLEVVVGWQASWFTPPAAKSRRVSLDATQKWVVRPSNRNPWGLEIAYYHATAEPFKYAPGFARL